MATDFAVLKIIPKLTLQFTQMSNNLCKDFQDGDNNTMSSAYLQYVAT